jgi:hypothetical protein
LISSGLYLNLALFWARSFYLTSKGENTMAAWSLFAVLAFLVFGVPTIDWLYRLRVRRDDLLWT